MMNKYKIKSKNYWNPDFSNLLGKQELVRKIGSSKNRKVPSTEIKSKGNEFSFE